jgi:hypothetical protein
MGSQKSGPIRQRVPVCFFAVFGYMVDGSPVPPCDGGLVKCHLIPRQVLKANHLEHHVWNGCVWVWGCGGLTGIAGHHGMLDHSRTLKLPRSAIPAATETFACQHHLIWYLDREYGWQTEQAEGAAG